MLKSIGLFVTLFFGVAVVLTTPGAAAAVVGSTTALPNPANPLLTALNLTNEFSATAGALYALGGSYYALGGALTALGGLTMAYGGATTAIGSIPNGLVQSVQNVLILAATQLPAPFNTTIPALATAIGIASVPGGAVTGLGSTVNAQGQTLNSVGAGFNALGAGVNQLAAQIIALPNALGLTGNASG